MILFIFSAQWPHHIVEVTTTENAHLLLPLMALRLPKIPRQIPKPWRQDVHPNLLKQRRNWRILQGTENIYFFREINFIKKLMLNQLFVCIFIEPALIHLRGPSAWSLQCPLLYHAHLQLGRPATTVSNNPRKDFTLSHKL